MKKLQLEVASDVVCPWCYIGKRRLEKALELLEGELEVEVRWLPFQLNPDMPADGIPRAEYRKAKFGSLERSKQLDARVIAEGKGEGIDFAFDRMETPAEYHAGSPPDRARPGNGGQRRRECAVQGALRSRHATSATRRCSPRSPRNAA